MEVEEDDVYENRESRETGLSQAAPTESETSESKSGLAEESVNINDVDDDASSTSSYLSTPSAFSIVPEIGKNSIQIESKLSTQSSKSQTAERMKIRSAFSLQSSDSDRSLIEDATMERVWGPAQDWPYNGFFRNTVKLAHSEHIGSAIDVIGPLPDIKSQLTKDSLLNRLSVVSGYKPLQASTDISTERPSSEPLSEIKEEINEEEKFFKEIHPDFSGNHNIIIWSPVDGIYPSIRLRSLNEVICLSFCPHDANLLVGGCNDGSIVLWDLFGMLKDKSDALHYATDPTYIESRNMISAHLNWRRSKVGFKQMRPTAQTLKKDTHSTKIIAIQWLHEDKEFDYKFCQVVPRKSSLKKSLQFLTVSEDKVIKVWDLRCEPKSPLCYAFPDKGFNRSSSAKQPSQLQHPVSHYRDLHRRWPFTFSAEAKRDDRTFFFSECAFSSRRYLGDPSNDMTTDEDKTIDGAFFGTLDGNVGYLTFDGAPIQTPNSGTFDSLTISCFKPYHDGPVNCISRHPILDYICISTGGHVFAIWNLNYPHDPIKWVRNKDVMMTYCGWSKLRSSVFTVSRSDGLIEFWDLIFYSHRPKIDPLSTGGGITMSTDWIIPPDKHFLAIADNNAALKYYSIEGKIVPLTEKEEERLKKMIDAEPERKTRLNEWSQKWLSEHVRKRASKSAAAEKETALTPAVQCRVKDSDGPACNMYMAQLYQWYIRRRGGRSLWLDEADKRWYAQELAHMKEQILSNKMWDQKKMDVVMRQLDVKEKREAIRKQRMQEILDQAEHIFKKAVADIFLKKDIEIKASNISVRIDEPKEFDMSAAMKETHLLFGEESEQFEKEKLADVARFPLKERKMLEVFAKYRQVRIIFNDSRRYRDSKLKWLRNKLRKEVEKYGCELIESQSRADTLMKWEKYERRIRDIEQLRSMYGIKYNPLWDKDKRVSRFEERMAIGSIPLRYTVSKRRKRNKGLDLDAIVGTVEISSPSFLEKPSLGEDKGLEELEKGQDLVVEIEETRPLPQSLSRDQERLLREASSQFSFFLPDIKKIPSIPSIEEQPPERVPSGGVLPLPDIVPRLGSTQPSNTSEPEEEQLPVTEKDFKPYLETLLARLSESSDSTDEEDFEPDIAIMEKHRDVDSIVDKLSGVYAMLKADVDVKPELHRFKWETTEEYIVSDDEEDKKSSREDVGSNELEQVVESVHQETQSSQYQFPEEDEESQVHEYADDSFID